MSQMKKKAKFVYAKNSNIKNFKLCILENIIETKYNNINTKKIYKKDWTTIMNKKENTFLFK